MTPNLVLAVLVGVLFATGVYLLLARSITRALIGLLLMGNGSNILFLVASGRAGRAPIVTGHDSSGMSDPLPQAMVLTAIVITLGMTAFLLAMAHRSWQLERSDVVRDDPEDVEILRRAEADDLSDSDFVGDDLDEGTAP
ncbi:MAG TPA: Na(+)/H(+) antiporter subunit C [Actinomycetales bacterium]|nr:Na(+)/H(+) antiporter subunit C [Actinomycetales bacterium]